MYNFSDVLLQPEDARVVAGSQFRLDKERNTFTSPLHEILLHENFSRSTHENNLAIGYVNEFASVVAQDKIYQAYFPTAIECHTRR